MSRFGKIELSDPVYENAGLRFLTFNSPALQGRGDVTLYIPPKAGELTNMPLVLLLHGVYCSHWAWALKGGVHNTAAELIDSGEIPPMVLAMPSDGLWAEGSGYLPHQTADYEKWIVDDVISCVLQVLPQVRSDSDLFIAGLSMGGYGALRLGAKYPDRFRGISAHSAVTRFERLSNLVSLPSIPVIKSHPDETSIIYWLTKHEEQLPALRFDCGRDDVLIEDNRELHRKLKALGIAHHYEEFPGGHTWPYWTKHVRRTLRFFGEITQDHEYNT